MSRSPGTEANQRTGLIGVHWPGRFRLFSTLVLTLLLAFADLTGNWQAEVEVAGNAGGPSFSLKQAADGTLTGTYEGALGSAPLKGKVSGDKVEWSFQVEPQGEKITVTYQGTVKSDGSLTGTLSIPGLGEGSWTARKR